MKRQIFSEEALERLSSPEQLDMLMPVPSGRGWIALTGVGMLLVVGLVWSLLGSISTTVQGDGLLMRFEGFQWVAAKSSGTITKIYVREGDPVAQGDPLVELQAMTDEQQPSTTTISSPRSGRVLDVAVIVGTVVDMDAPLVSVESPRKSLSAVVYVPAADGYKVESGMQVKVLPATESRHSSSQLTGRVATAAKFPATRVEMMSTLQNEDWVQTLLAQGPSLEVIIEIESEEPLTKLYSGTPCQATITVKKRRPIELLVPVSGS